MRGAHDRNRTGEPLPYQGSALPTELRGHFCTDFRCYLLKVPKPATYSLWSGRRGSNSRHSAWKAEALPTELLPLLRLTSSKIYQRRQQGFSRCAANFCRKKPCSTCRLRLFTGVSYIQLSQFEWWWGEDLNLRRRRRQIYSLFPLTTREPHRSQMWSQRRDSNPRPTDYKSVALPTELRWLDIRIQNIILYLC
jgi:hypothetical protein